MTTPDPSTYKTNNPIGSNAAEDVSDNARVFDYIANSPETDVIDRLGKSLKTVAGIQADAKAAYQSANEDNKGAYAVGVVFDKFNDVYLYNDTFYGVKSTVTLPYTATQADPANDANLMVRGGASQQFVKNTVYEVAPMPWAEGELAIVNQVYVYTSGNSLPVSVYTATPNVTMGGEPDENFIPAGSTINSSEEIAPNIGSCGFTDIEPSYFQVLKDAAEVTIDSDSMTVKRKSAKAWKYPCGIKDSAVAGSFMLADGVDSPEPSTQVTGFTSVDNIGVYAGRDAVALFAQVDSAPSLIETSNTTFTAASVTSPDFSAIFDKIKVGMIVDVNFGSSVNWIGGVVTSKTAPSTLNVSSWRKIDGTSDPASTPTNGDTVYLNRHNNIWAANFNAIINGQDKGANQAIGIETGLSCNRAGTGANSKGYFAVNLGGERPEYGFTMSGLWQKGYTSAGSSVWGYGSNGDAIGFTADDSTGNSFQSTNPAGHHLECRDAGSNSQVIIRNDGKVAIGTNSESGGARLNLRGSGSFSQNYNQTEFQIFDPTVALVDRQGFFIAQTFNASTVGADFIMGCGGSSNHQYSLKIQTQNTDRMRFQLGGNIESGVDNTQTFGTASKRWSEVFAGNGTINTSDETMKSFLGDFSDKERSVAVKVKALLTKFKWNESIEREENGGKKARIHVGIGAQSLAEAFSSEGLDASDYAMFCYDEWEEERTTIQTNRGQTVTIEKEIEQQVIETVTVSKIVEDVKLINGKYTLVRESKDVEVNQPKYEMHKVYDVNGNQVLDISSTKDQDGNYNTVSTARVIAVPVMETIKITEEVPAEPIYEEVITPAGSRYGVRLDQVLSFILANT